MQSTNFQLTGERLYAAFYLNELLMHLIPISFSASLSESSGEILFQDYQEALGGLLDLNHRLEIILRDFEIKLLRLLGLWPDFSRDSLGNPLNPHDFYEVFVENSPRKISFHQDQADYANSESSGGGQASQASHAFRGDVLLKLAAQDWSAPEVLMAGKKILRHWLSYYCEGKIFKSRECFELLMVSGR